MQFPAGGWQFASESVPVTVRKTPTWAIVLGVIGLFIFLIGIVFFSIKTDETVYREAITITTAGGRFTGTKEAWRGLGIAREEKPKTLNDWINRIPMGARLG